MQQTRQFFHIRILEADFSLTQPRGNPRHLTQHQTPLQNHHTQGCQARTRHRTQLQTQHQRLQHRDRAQQICKNIKNGIKIKFYTDIRTIKGQIISKRFLVSSDSSKK